MSRNSHPKVHAAVVASCLAAAVAVGMPSLLSAQSAQPDPAKIKVCSLLTKEQVKKHLPWRPELDQFPPEEEALGNYGSSCNYPTVHIQVMPSRSSMIEQAKKKGGLEPISGLGEEAYFHNNKGMYAELYVRQGKYLFTVQANVNGPIATAKDGAIKLAKDLAAKLR